MKSRLGTTLRALKSNVVRHLNFTLSSQLNGQVFQIPVTGGLGASNRAIADPWMSTLLEELLPIREGAFIDVGANLGQTLIKVKNVDPNRSYFGFEPHAICVAYLRQLIQANRFTEAVIFPGALFNRDCVLALDSFSEGGVDSSASLIPGFRMGERIAATDYVPAFTFSSVAETAKIGQIGFIKIDVEGAELEVTETLKAAIARWRPIILIEVLPAYSSDNHFRIERQQKLECLLAELQYQWLRVIKTPDDNLATLNLVQGIGIHSDLRACDYLLLPAEMSANIIGRS